MATKSISVVACNEELPFIKSHDPLITWSSDFDFLGFVGLECKRLSHNRLLVSVSFYVVIRKPLKYSFH